MKAKQNIVMVLVLTILLGSIGIGLSTVDKTSDADIQVEENIVPDSFCLRITAGENIPGEVLNAVTSFIDDYFKSIYTLQLQDINKHFINEEDGNLASSAIKFVVESRKLYDFDFKMSDASYEINIIDYTQDGDEYTINYLEDDSFKFNFLDGIETKLFGVENSIVIKKDNDEYKILKYDRVQDFYVLFSENADSPIDKVYDHYFKKLSSLILEEREMRKQNRPYVSSKSVDVKYDRDAAVDYINTYYHNRAVGYYDFSDEGGNCQNLASQALKAGGIIMDEDGESQWYYNDHLDYVPSWVHVSSFYDYCSESDGQSIVSEVNVPISYGEPGDIIQVGADSISHTTMISKVVNGHILINCNSIDMKNYPIEAYAYSVRKLIKILGSNY